MLKTSDDMSNPSESYTLAIPGTDETRELTAPALLQELAAGRITSEYWVWSRDHEDWKQISEIPALNPVASRPPAPVFAPPAPAPLPQTVVYAPDPLPKKKKKKLVRRRADIPGDDEGISFFKLGFALLYIAVAVVIAANYFFIDRKLDDALSHTPFVLVPAHAHLASFIQPNAIVIHVLPSHELTRDNLPEFLQTLAQSTPRQPFNQTPFGLVALSSAWFTDYALSGPDWQSLGAMSGAKPQERRDFIADHLCNGAGQHLIHPDSKRAPGDLKAARARVWDDLATHFAGN